MDSEAYKHPVPNQVEPVRRDALRVEPGGARPHGQVRVVVEREPRVQDGLADPAGEAGAVRVDVPADERRQKDRPEQLGQRERREDEVGAEPVGSGSPPAPCAAKNAARCRPDGIEVKPVAQGEFEPGKGVGNRLDRAGGDG